MVPDRAAVVRWCAVEPCVCVAARWPFRTTIAVGLGRNRVLAEGLVWLRGRAACPAGLTDEVRDRSWRCDTENKGETERTRRGNGAEEQRCCDRVRLRRDAEAEGGHAETWVVHVSGSVRVERWSVPSME